MTKRIFLVVLVTAITVCSVSAKLRFGVKAGVNIDNLKLTNVMDNLSTDNQCGFTGGVTTEFIATIIGIGFDLSLMYTHMKSDIEYNKYEGAVSKNFLEIPLNLKYKIGVPVISSIVQPMIFTGPTMALKLDKSIFGDLKSKTVQMGWNLGLGFEFFKHLQINGGYTFGINNVAKMIPGINNSTNLGKIKLKNNYWTVTAAYMF